MKKLILNQLGNGAVITMVMAGVIAAGTLSYMNSVENNNKSLAQSKGWDKGQLMLDKVKTLANFLVSNSVIACKEGAFSNQTEGHRCEWTGHQVLGGKLTKINVQDVGLNDTGYDDKGFLEFELDTGKIKTTDGSKKDTGFSLTGKIGFKLYDLKSDKWNLKGKLSEVPKEYSHADKDNTFILIKIEVADKHYNAEENKSPDDKEVKVRNTGKYIKSFVAVRRPLSFPIVTLGDASCKTSCKVASSQDDNPSCRGEQNSEGENKDVAVPARTVNSGPGILYNLVLEKETTFNKTYFPDQKPVASKAVNAMPQRDYLLPGEASEWVASVTCQTHKTTSPVTITKSRSQGTCRQNGESIPCPESGDDAQVSVGQHSQPGGKVRFILDISKPGDDINAEESYMASKNICEKRSYRKIKKKIDKDNECQMANESHYYSRKSKKKISNFSIECSDESKFTVSCKGDSCQKCHTEFYEKKYKVKLKTHRGLSSIEPARVISDKTFDGDFPMMDETQVVIRIIPTH
jgi:hypothetical protein